LELELVTLKAEVAVRLSALEMEGVRVVDLAVE
jgi:hypothetical protein